MDRRFRSRNSSPEQAADRTIAAPTQAPNIVLIISDDQAWTDYRFMGHQQIETPRLDRLASESLVFSRGYVPSSLCCPSLASMVTGLYPHQHMITGNDPKPPRKMSYPERQADEQYQALCTKNRYQPYRDCWLNRDTCLINQANGGWAVIEEVDLHTA